MKTVTWLLIHWRTNQNKKKEFRFQKKFPGIVFLIEEKGSLKKGKQFWGVFINEVVLQLTLIKTFCNVFYGSEGKKKRKISLDILS